jgi:signal transduction histidine kinase
VIRLPNGQSRLAIAVGPPTTAAGTFVYEEYTVDPSRPLPIGSTQPFHELNAALYAATTPQASKLLLATTTKLPLHGTTASAPVTSGGSPWVVVVAAKQPLSGTLADEVPLILLLATLVIGLAMAAVVEGVGRRRDYALGLVFDRTSELRQSVQQLEQTQEALLASERLAALGQMAATVGHELRNPLGVLTNSMYLIRAATAGTADERLNRHLSTADREIAAATLIVSDLLEFARPRAAAPRAVDVADLLEETLSVAPPASGIAATIDDVAGLPPVLADRDQLRQVLLNLLTNAYEAMQTGGSVRLSAQLCGDGIEVTVRDDGPGMDEATAQRVFEPFFSSKIKGTGLGLAVSKRIVESHGGSLSLDSAEGDGCTARVWLPLARVDAPAGA